MLPEARCTLRLIVLSDRPQEGSHTHEIKESSVPVNRLLRPGMLLKRAARGQLALLPAVHAVLNGKFTNTRESGDRNEEMRLVQNAKKIALLSIGIADQKYRAELQQQQEVLMSISDIIMKVLAMESTLLRSRKIGESVRGETAADVCAVFLRQAMERVEISCRNLFGACLDGDALRRNMSVLGTLADYDPTDAVTRRRNIASRLLASERYVWD